MADYASHFRVKKIATACTFGFGKPIEFLANALTNEQIGMKETDDGRRSIYFHFAPLATFDDRDCVVRTSLSCKACFRTTVSTMFPISQFEAPIAARGSGSQFACYRAADHNEPRVPQPRTL